MLFSPFHLKHLYIAIILLSVLNMIPSFLYPCKKSMDGVYKTVILSRYAQRALFASKKDPKDYDNPESVPIISWYPGHIAKAERELGEYLKKVDVVIEVRDARIPLATTHPLVPKWIGKKPLIVAFSRLDQISSKALADWKKYYSTHPVHPDAPNTKAYFIDGKLGTGVTALKKEALKAGIAVNERRVRRGIQPRAVRAAVIGFPNVGKSALINRLLGRKLAKSRNLPGVTRQLQWIRIGGLEGSQVGALELLDSPGIIPARQYDQQTAVKLAICNDIGEASYDRVLVAAIMCDELIALARNHPGYVQLDSITSRYKLSSRFIDMTGEEIVDSLAESQYHGNQISAADKLLSDFRKGYFDGLGSLEAPPPFDTTTTKPPVAAATAVISAMDLIDSIEPFVESDENIAVEEGIEHHSSSNNSNEEEKKIVSPLDVGKGFYDGW